MCIPCDVGGWCAASCSLCFSSISVVPLSNPSPSLLAAMRDRTHGLSQHVRRAGSPQSSWAPLNPTPRPPLSFLQDAAKQRDALGLIQQLWEHEMSGASSTHGVPAAPSAPSFCSVPPQPLPPTPAAAGSSRGPQERDATGAGTRQPRGRARRAMCLQQRSAKPPQGSRQQGTRGALRRDLTSKYVRGKNAKGLSSGCHRRYLLDAGTTKQICSAEPQHPARQTLPLKLCGKNV